MKKIVIEYDEITEMVGLDSKQLVGMAEGAVISLFLQTYMQVASRILKTHNCGDPKCEVVPLHREVVASVNSIFNLNHLKRHQED